ncbi:MAG: DUF4332 domain-containing protein [Myxococcaceae bacterium]
MPRITDARPTSLSLLKGVTADEVKAFKKAGITNNEQLLARAKTSGDVSKLAKAVGLSSTRVKEAVNRADLVRLDGMGPATANLFENAGVNSVKELASRNAAALFKTLADYAKKNPALNVKEPSAALVSDLVSKAKQAVSGTPPGPTPITDFGAAQTFAAGAMRDHVEHVLFGTDPAGATFREAILAHRPASEWPAVKQQMLGEIDSTFFANAERTEKPDSFLFVGSLLGLYTEVSVKKSGELDRVFVEID